MTFLLKADLISAGFWKNKTLLGCDLDRITLLSLGSGVYAGSPATTPADCTDAYRVMICMFFDRRVETLGKALSER
jgi:hypothetical protein